jgi:hypothetical protein
MRIKYDKAFKVLHKGECTTGRSTCIFPTATLGACYCVSEHYHSRDEWACYVCRERKRCYIDAGRLSLCRKFRTRY